MCALTGVPGGRRLCGSETTLLPALRKPTREGGDHCPVPLSRCPAPTPAARLRRSRGSSWTRRKWVPTFLGPGKQTLAPGRAEGGSRVSWTLTSGALSALCLQGPHGASRGLARAAWADSLRIAFLPGRLEKAWLTRSVSREGVNVKHPLLRK